MESMTVLKRRSRTKRRGDVLVTTVVTVSTCPAVIDYKDILAAVDIVPDEDFGPPWKEFDGDEHVIREVERDEQRQSFRYMHTRTGHDAGLVYLEDEHEDSYKYLHARGMSKQMAREETARILRSHVERIIRWHEEGWWCYGVVCKYQKYEESVWGVLVDTCDDPYLTEVSHEMASQVARRMVNDGYTITNFPVFNRRHKQTGTTTLSREPVVVKPPHQLYARKRRTIRKINP